MNFQERGRVFCWNIAAPAKWKNWIYRIEQIAQWRRNSFRNLFDNMIILFDVWLVWPWLDFGTLIRLGPLWLRWESNLPPLTMSILWEKKVGKGINHLLILVEKSLYGEVNIMTLKTQFQFYEDLCLIGLFSLVPNSNPDEIRRPSS